MESKNLDLKYTDTNKHYNHLNIKGKIMNNPQLNYWTESDYGWV